MADLLEQRFRKVLIAHYSPQNKCFVEDGILLYAPATKDKDIRHGTEAEFLSAIDHTTSSKFGWVKTEEAEFTVKDLIAGRLKLEPTVEQVKSIVDMLNAIAKLPDATPVAASYFSRGIERRELALTFHKVFFHA